MNGVLLADAICLHTVTAAAYMTKLVFKLINMIHIVSKKKKNTHTVLVFLRDFPYADVISFLGHNKIAHNASIHSIVHSRGTKVAIIKEIKRRTFYSQHRGDNEAAHPQQVIHCHKTGFCNMNKGM